MKDQSLGDRMKNNYENRSRVKLTRRMPVMLRLDGKAFHTFTRGCERPFDERLGKAMDDTARYLCENIQGARVAYVQSDEISILLTDYERIKTDAWFDYGVQKMCSIASGLASAFFSTTYGKLAVFDCRAFNLPMEEVVNYFIWRQQDWIRNSVQMVGQANFSHNQLHKKTIPMIHDMLHEIGINWARDFDAKWKNGRTLMKIDRDFEEFHDIIFQQDRERFLPYLTVGIKDDQED